MDAKSKAETGATAAQSAILQGGKFMEASSPSASRVGCRHWPGRKIKRLFTATRQEDIELVNLLLEDYVNLDIKDSRGWTVLHEAARVGNKEIVDSLLRNGASVNVTDKQGCTPLHRAASWGHSSVVELLIHRGCNVNEKDAFGETALNKAIYWGHSFVQSILQQYGAQKYDENNSGIGTLMPARRELEIPWSCTVKRRTLKKSVHESVAKAKMTEKLIYHDRFVEKDKFIKEPVHERVEKDKVTRKPIFENVQKDKIIEEPVHGGVEKDKFIKEPVDERVEKDKVTRKRIFENVRKDKIIEEPVHGRVEKDKFIEEKVQERVQKDKVMTRKPIFENVRKDKITEEPVHGRVQKDKKCLHADIFPIYVPVGSKQQDIKDLPKHRIDDRYDRCQLVDVSCSCDIDSRDEYECSPLHRASLKGFTPIVECLINRGSSLNAKDSDGWMPLHGASAGGHLETVRCLIERGADIEAVDNMGCTPLHRAAMNGNTSVARLLLQRGCRTDILDADGWSPLHGAAKYGHVDMVKLLISRGANVNMVDKLENTPLDMAKAADHFECIVVLEEEEMRCSISKRELKQFVADNSSKEDKKYDVEAPTDTNDRLIGKATECTLGKEGGNLSIGNVNLVVPPGSLSKETNIRVSLQDPADFYSVFDDAGLINAIAIAHPVIKLEPSATNFNAPVTLSTVLPHKIVTDEELLVVHGSYSEDNPGKPLWELVNLTDIEMSDAGRNTAIVQLAHFSWVIFLYKTFVIKPKAILSWLNLKCFRYHTVFACKKNTPHAPYTDVRIIFLSEEIYQESSFRQHEDDMIENLKKEGYRVFYNHHNDKTYVTNGELLEVTLDLDPGFEMCPEDASTTKDLKVESTKWWTSGDQLKFIVCGDNASETISGKVTIKKSSSPDDVISFKANDWFGYLKNTLKLGEVSNLLPVADKLGLEEEKKEWLIDTTWQCDQKQLEKILQFSANPDSNKPRSKLKRQLSEVESCDVQVSNRGQMHVQNLRKLEVNPENLGRDPDGDKMRYEISVASKLILSVLQDSCIEVAEDVEEIEICCLASEDFTDCLKKKRQLPDKLKEMIDDLLGDRAQYEVIKYVVPRIVQFVKEIFRCEEEEKPSLNGMRGISAEFLSRSRRKVGELVVQQKGPNLLSEISKILERLCVTNELNLRSRGNVSTDHFKKWGRCMLLETFLETLSHFFLEAKGMKIRKRIEIKVEMMQEILDEGDKCQYMARDLGDIAKALLCFVQFVPARLVQFGICCMPEELLEAKADGSVSKRTNGAIYLQSFTVLRKGACQILVKATAKINIDGEESETPCLELVECISKKKYPLSKSCKGEKTGQLVRAPDQQFEEKVEIKLMYNHRQKKFTCESPNFVQQSTTVPERRETLELCRLPPSHGQQNNGICPTVEQEPPLELIQFFSSSLVPREGLSDNDVQNQNIDGQRKFQLFLQWLHTESVEKITDEIRLHLGITSQCSLLKHLSEETKNKIRRFSQFIKSPSVQMQDLFQSVRKKLPAGCTGPYLEEDTLVEGIPHETRQKVCEAIWVHDAWKPLADYVGLTNSKMRHMEKKGDPADQVLIEWETKRLTVKHLYDELVDRGFEVIADLL